MRYLSIFVAKSLKYYCFLCKSNNISNSILFNVSQIIGTKKQAKGDPFDLFARREIN